MLKTAVKMAMLSALAYKDKKAVKSRILELGYSDSNFYWFNNNNTQAFMITDDNEIIISFRGTEKNYGDILTDIKISKTEDAESGRIHLGFSEYFENVREDMLTEINKIKKASKTKEKKVICTGHSLGAALATILASRIDADEIYTFGSPRVGNDKFVDGIDDDEIMHYRFVNNNDVVARVPKIGYEHNGHLHYINHVGKIRNMSCYQRFKDRLRGSWCSGKIFTDRFGDHKIGEYQKKIEEIYKKASAKELKRQRK